MEVNADIELEKKLLSAMLLNEGEAIPRVAEVVKADDFYRPEHAKIFKALIKLCDDGKPVDVLLTMEQLKSSGELKKVGRQYLLGIVNYEYTTARAVEYAKIVKKYSQLRSLAQFGRELTEAAVNATQEPDEIQMQLDKKLSSLKVNALQNMEDATEILLRQVQVALSPGIEKSISTKYFDLDKNLGGLKKSDLIILAARPAMGKTALALNIATNVAKEREVVFFSLEMSKAQLMNRILASASRVESTKIQESRLNDQEREDLLAGVIQLENMKMHIDDTAGLSLFELRQRARRAKQEYNVELIVIDYLQLIQASPEYKNQSRVQEVSEISRGLKILARELDIPILAIAQLNRSVELRADKRPILSDLRDSGSIEQDADIVMFLYRDEYYNQETELSNIAEINIAKNRNGKTTKFRMHYEPNYLLFSDLLKKEPY